MNRKTVTFVAATATLFLVAGRAPLSQRHVATFDDLAAGQPPQTFALIERPPGGMAAWQVLHDNANKVLGHAARARGGTDFAILEDLALADVTVSTRFRFPQSAQAAGLTWRFRDADNHYLVSLDLREQRVRIYRVARGTRTRLESEEDLELDPTGWHTVKIEHQGTRMRVWVDGVPVASARDRARTAPGLVGVWTPSDALVWFDDFRAEPLASRPDRND